MKRDDILYIQDGKAVVDLDKLAEFWDYLNASEHVAFINLFGQTLLQQNVSLRNKK